MAIAKATSAAVLEHKRLGNPIALWQNGRVTIVQPDDIVIEEQEAQ
jgi:hypothetical protein